MSSYVPIPHSFNAYENYNPVEEEQVVTKSSKQMESYEVIDFRSPPDCGSHLHNMSQKGISNNWMQCDLHQKNIQLPFGQSIYGNIDHHEYSVDPYLDESVKDKPDGPNPFPAASQGDYHESGLKMLGDASLRNNDAEQVRNLSTEELVRLAGEKYIHFSTNRVNGYTMFIHPYGSSAFSTLSLDETREVELAYQLLTAAEKVAHRQYDLASKILTRCEWVASNEGSPVERLVFYFAEALRKRIERETGIIISKRMYEQDKSGESTYLTFGSNPTFLAFHIEVPFSQVIQFTGIQAIIDHVATKNKIHLIDLNIRSGVQWTALMQALVEQKSPIQLLKITALGTREKDTIEETGKRLRSFAQSLSLPFSFNVIFLSDMKELKEEDFNIEADEAVAFYLHTVLRTMISMPDQLEHLMEVMGKMKPSVIVVAEVEANHNSKPFVNRFTETLFYYSAIFDSLETCMARSNEHRRMVEGVHFASGIHNIVSTEGEERTCRSVKIKVWRSFFERFGMIEVGLSESSLYQANLVRNQFPCGSCCTLENNGKCLLVGWKGTPIHSLSTWKFM